MAMEIQNGIGHHFLGSSFAHRTCVCKRTTINGHVSVSNHNDDFLLFAWGRSGGSKEYNRRRRLREALLRQHQEQEESDEQGKSDD